ncbi:glycerol-3-phosphate acyltransferase PlsX [Caldicoprobacter guelmensis]|uniref:phosphate acyltransferase PlsX n=1 Tax=Caldicoprobacter guelmensis TaxID=1170224 RepID=UPI00195E9420|nr:phosphate acyltransferase PlsX [Caldicoprobacter guelmensis]MBM7581222.1 glycerol-3-phosphate acyltransferase PlsX [Caldicoprobacter guelmensis]
MNIIVDAMGGDNAPGEIIQGCIDAAREYDVSLTLVGKEDVIWDELKKRNAPEGKFTVIHASEVIHADDSPVAAIRSKKDSSMVKGFELLKQDPKAVFVSAGNTGALMAGGLLIAGRIKGIDRPALAPMIPNLKRGTLLIDAGANAECKPQNLVQFAVMGSIYMEKVMGYKSPTVGLVNIGQEETKGNELTKEAYKLLKAEKSINFVGNVEPRDMLEGVVDVLVCDGFVGNVILKLTEGVALGLFQMIKEELTKNAVTKVGAMLLKPAFKRIKNRMDYAEHGGAPLLGIRGGVIKAHGSSDARAIKNAVRQAMLFIQNSVLDNISDYVKSAEEGK